MIKYQILYNECNIQQKINHTLYQMFNQLKFQGLYTNFCLFLIVSLYYKDYLIPNKFNLSDKFKFFLHLNKKLYFLVLYFHDIFIIYTFVKDLSILNILMWLQKFLIKKNLKLFSIVYPHENRYMLYKYILNQHKPY